MEKLESFGKRRFCGEENTNSLLGAVLCIFLLYTTCLIGNIAAQTASASQYPELPSETPAKFVPKTGQFRLHQARVVMIPMRDGVKLHTVILVPKGAKEAPILLTRTPYNADAVHHGPRRQTAPPHSRPHLAGL